MKKLLIFTLTVLMIFMILPVNSLAIGSDISTNDTDLDGIVDKYDSDIDGDGIKNIFDKDIDGDGILNKDDPAPLGGVVINGLLRGTIVGSDGNAISGVTISVGSVTALTDSNGAFSLLIKGSGTYSATISKTGYVTEVYNEILMTTGGITNIGSVMLFVEGAGDLEGTVSSDAAGTDPLNNVRLYLRRGINVESGDYDYESLTNENGEYSIADIIPGNYTVEVLLYGFKTQFFNVAIINGTILERNFVLSPDLTEGQTLILLSWTNDVLELDAHLTGPTGDGENRFHITWNNQIYSYNGQTYAEIIGQTTGFAPESTAIKINMPGGLYRFSVRSYYNNFSNSQAKVKVYAADGLTESFAIPANEDTGNLWTVFEMQDNVINPINTITTVLNDIDVT